MFIPGFRILGFPVGQRETQLCTPGIITRLIKRFALDRSTSSRNELELWESQKQSSIGNEKRISNTRSFGQRNDLDRSRFQLLAQDDYRDGLPPHARTRCEKTYPPLWCWNISVLPARLGFKARCISSALVQAARLSSVLIST